MVSLTLSTLDSDILQSIIKTICDIQVPDTDKPKPRTRLAPLSLVSRRLRSECLPHLFRKYSHSIRTPGRLISKKLWCFIKVLRIKDENVYYHNIDDQVLAAKELWEAFPEMTAVTTCIYTRSSGPDVTFVKALATLPSLSAFELENSLFQTTLDPEFSLISGLTRVAFRLTEGWRAIPLNGRWNFSVIQREAYYLSVLLSASASTLEYIEIPGETTCPEEMSKYHWPRLRHLVLYGVVPDRPLISWLRQSPLLRTLDVQCFHAANSPQFLIYPDSQFDVASRIPEVRFLTLANPSPKDRIFDHLSDIHYLSFPALPEPAYHARGVSFLCTPIWNVTQAMEALLRRQIPDLVELRISVQDHECSDLIHTISQVFPSLKVLELHRYPIEVPRSAEAFEIPFSLADLPRLTDLRLDLNLSEDDEFRSYQVLGEETALLVAESIPQLESVSLFSRAKKMHGQPVSPPALWRKFNVSRTIERVQVMLELITYVP